MAKSILVAAASLCLVFSLAACAGGISPQARSQVTYRGHFNQLQQSPDAHVGEIVLLGGRVLGTSANSLFSEIGVLHMPLDWNERPVDSDSSAGRFLIRSEGFLDPEIYKKGELVSVVGQLSGSEERLVGSYDYRYPIIRAIEIRRWPRWDAYFPAVHFGFGCGASL